MNETVKITETLMYLLSILVEGTVDIMRFGVVYLEVMAVLVITSLILLVMTMHALGYDKNLVDRLKLKRHSKTKTEPNNSGNETILIGSAGKPATVHNTAA